MYTTSEKVLQYLMHKYASIWGFHALEKLISKEIKDIREQGPFNYELTNAMRKYMDDLK